MSFMMSYNSVKETEQRFGTASKVRDIETFEGSDTDIETGHYDAEESSSFLGRKLKDGETNPGGTLSTSTPFITTLIPWVINLILTIALVSLSWKTTDLRRASTTSHQPPPDLMFSEYLP